MRIYFSEQKCFTESGPKWTVQKGESGPYKIILSSDLFLRYQIQLSALVVDNISIGSNKNINFACQYSRLIDNVEHVFDVTQVGFQKSAIGSLRTATEFD